jgi:TPP-dependent pyruvate/acetoin dehydrogenase alpha subunit
MELAALLHVPVVFVCENNQYAMSFPARKWTTSERLAKFGELYGIPGVSIDGNDVLAVREAVMGSARAVRDEVETELKQILREA